MLLNSSLFGPSCNSIAYALHYAPISRCHHLNRPKFYYHKVMHCSYIKQMTYLSCARTTFSLVDWDPTHCKLLQLGISRRSSMNSFPFLRMRWLYSYTETGMSGKLKELTICKNKRAFPARDRLRSSRVRQAMPYGNER